MACIRTNLTLKFITYDGEPGSRPPLFDPIDLPEKSIPHEFDGRHLELMVIPEGHCKPLSMSFMLFYVGAEDRFEWCSKYSAKGLFDEGGNEEALDGDGYISFPLKKGDRWSVWPNSFNDSREFVI